MKRLVLSSMLFATLGLALSSCELSSESAELEWSSGLSEIASYEFTSSGAALADGEAVIQFSLKLMSKNGNPISGKAPKFEITNGNNVQAASSVHNLEHCSVSNKGGMSFCYFKSSTAGIKQIKFLNLPGTPIKELAFNPTIQSSSFVHTQGGKSGFTGQGYKLEMSVSQNIVGTQTSTTSGYKVILAPH